MPRITFSENGSSSFQRLLGHNQKVMEKWNDLGEALEAEGFLSSNLKEQVRRTLAQENGCEYCKAKGLPEPHLFDEKTSVAVGFAQAFLSYRGSMPLTVFNVLHNTFDNEEISELCAFVCFTTAAQYFGAITGLQPGADKYILSD
ncbi:carboxymuconolactone decarboxylase family protein [Pseudalkalibacillus berkeleyi]|uniref:Carboxymuconolactone decarboxylase family protein n=1 Tax=Pseudalkalibacillus berkeleyi TaxID=1069813 RepID=A0ABS9GZS8_9BACL|nr:carboxymuconolactone decarboxylase family protein [Pseudalkalibacillus berkeleyi]MCF6138252.1 carboxymuconolactone decarboxylase family protein [Pseudalkalibacillus berkeleyi]